MARIKIERLERLVSEGILTRKVDKSTGFHPLITTELYQSEKLIARENHYSAYGMNEVE